MGPVVNIACGFDGVNFRVASTEAVVLAEKMILGKRDRPASDTQATNKLTKVFEEIKAKY